MTPKTRILGTNMATRCVEKKKKVNFSDQQDENVRLKYGKVMCQKEVDGEI